MVREPFLPTNKGKIQQGQHDKGKCQNLCQEGFQMQAWHQILCQDTVAESEVHRMRDEIKLFVDSDLQKVLKFLKMDY